MKKSTPSAGATATPRPPVLLPLLTAQADDACRTCRGEGDRPHRCEIAPRALCALTGSCLHTRDLAHPPSSSRAFDANDAAMAAIIGVFAMFIVATGFAVTVLATMRGGHW